MLLFREIRSVFYTLLANIGTENCQHVGSVRTILPSPLKVSVFLATAYASIIIVIQDAA
jgi:hypothetical protein